MTTPAEDRAGLAPLPPVAPGDVPVGSADLWGAERDTTQNFGPDYSQPLPSVADSPHWTEIKT
jgi:hypothetical protein